MGLHRGQREGGPGRRNRCRPGKSQESGLTLTPAHELGLPMRIGEIYFLCPRFKSSDIKGCGYYTNAHVIVLSGQGQVKT